ncbi:hypothetical protein BJF81_11625 [Ornithinimicrobium sp. CNJ-824]|uniref:hypothetical protein n=1 Tax=Ornithinimicrobium sp. CNJ-824 TaxID=1904966 RepID=UPI0009692298|nr:hypothetical protein [Ornithinimicrobium sp. CNJ-824]OLT23040.1 hypothetical protein BJF81_11625 [Ornithinimicrobium sp. CNJ-824]
MLYKVVLRLAGVDLRAPQDWEVFGEGTKDVHLEADGPLSLATLYAESAQEVMARAAGFAALLKVQASRASVAGVHDELASVATIASRVGLGPEAVRLWVQGERRGEAFPRPVQIVGTGAKPQQLFSWREVLDWVRENVGCDPEQGVAYLSASQLAELGHQVLVTPSADPLGVVATCYTSWSAVIHKQAPMRLPEVSSSIHYKSPSHIISATFGRNPLGSFDLNARDRERSS